MKKITVVLAILLTVLVSGCGKKQPISTETKYNISEKDKSPTSVEESYDTTKYTWDEYSKTELTEGKKITVLWLRQNNEPGGKMSIWLKKINKDCYLHIIIFGGMFCYHGNCGDIYDVIKAVDKNAGELTMELKDIAESSWLINDEQIKIMSTHGLDLRFYEYPFPTGGYLGVQVPAVYVQGFLKRVNEVHNKTK